MQKHDLLGFEKDEKIIFDYIVTPRADGKSVIISQIIDQNLTSRASTYRHLNSLVSRGFIKIEGRGRLQSISIENRFKNFANDFKKMLSNFPNS